MIADYEDLQESEAAEIYARRFKNLGVFVKVRTRISRVQTELQDFPVVQDHHRQRREISSEKMTLKSKKATMREAKQKIRGPRVKN